MGLGNEFVVCTVAGSCVGVADGGKEGELIVSFKSGAIQVYNIHDFRIVCSWQLPSSEQLLCPAIFQKHTQLFWTIGSQQGLLQWPRDASILPHSSHPLHSTQTPVQLLSCAASTLLVYSNGDVGVVKGGACSLAPKRRKEWTLCLAAVSCDRTVCVVGTARDVTIGIAESADGKLKQPFVSSVQSRGAELVSSCVCGDKLLLLFVQGELLMVPLEPPLQPVRCPPILPTPGNAQLLSLGTDYFALLSAQSLQLWDTEYHTCQQQIKTVIGSKSKVWCVDGCVYVWSDETLRGWRLEGAHATLAAALGKRPSGNAISVTLPSWPLTCEDIEDGETGPSAAVRDYLQALASKARTPDLRTFMSLFTTRSLTPDLCYSDVIERLLCEEEFWGCEALSSLLQAGLVPNHLDVLNEAMNRKDWKIADLCLTHGPTPSEDVIVSALQRFVSLPESIETQSGGILFRKDFLCKLVCCPFTDVLMQSSLAAAPFLVVKEVLIFLSHYVGVPSLLTPAPNNPPIPYDVVLEWIALILDVHFTHLTLDQQCRQLLLSLQSKVFTQVTCYNRLSVLSSLTDNRNIQNSLYKLQTEIQ